MLKLLVLSLWKMLVPGWRFFQEPGPMIVLECFSDNKWQSYWNLVESPKRKLFFNAHFNMNLFMQTFIEKRISELNDRGPDLEELKIKLEGVKEYVQLKNSSISKVRISLAAEKNSKRSCLLEF